MGLTTVQRDCAACNLKTCTVTIGLHQADVKNNATLRQLATGRASCDDYSPTLRSTYDKPAMCLAERCKTNLVHCRAVRRHWWQSFWIFWSACFTVDRSKFSTDAFQQISNKRIKPALLLGVKNRTIDLNWGVFWHPIIPLLRTTLRDVTHSALSWTDQAWYRDLHTADNCPQSCSTAAHTLQSSNRQQVSAKKLYISECYCHVNYRLHFTIHLPQI